MWLFVLYSFSFSIILRSFSIPLITLLVQLSSFILSHYPSFSHSSYCEQNLINVRSLSHSPDTILGAINQSQRFYLLIPTISNYVKNTIWLFGIQRKDSLIIRNNSTMEERLISPILFIHRNE